jgi:hypothetical protein
MVVDAELDETSRTPTGTASLIQRPESGDGGFHPLDAV